MAVISLTITESTEQIVSGIPKTIVITANIASTIFYTLNGVDPDLNSTIYTGPIKLPTNQLSLIVKIFATNGTDSSPIISTTYQTNMLGKNVRFPHSSTDVPAQGVPTNDPRPFGSNPIQPDGHYLGPADAGMNVYNPLLPGQPNGFDGNENPTAYTNAPFIGIPTQDLPVIISETDALGQTGPAIGFLPKSKIQSPVPPKEESSTSDKVFDPKALVIFQDYTNPNNLMDPVDVNRASFTLENVETTRQGNQYFNVGPDTPAPTGNFLRQHYNPRDNTITYYYFDSSVNRWIISKTSYTPAANAHNYSNIVFGKGEGAGWVFAWRPFAQRYLY